jgi:hypothetical protein
MDETSLIVGCAAVGLLCIFAMMREVLLKKERDAWVRKFERRNRSNYDDRGI